MACIPNFDVIFNIKNLPKDYSFKINLEKEKEKYPLIFFLNDSINKSYKYNNGELSLKAINEKTDFRFGYITVPSHNKNNHYKHEVNVFYKNKSIYTNKFIFNVSAGYNPCYTLKHTIKDKKGVVLEFEGYSMINIDIDLSKAISYKEN